MLYRKFKRDRTTVYAPHWKVQEILIANGPMAADIALLESLLSVPHAINNTDPAVAAVDQCDLAQEQEVGLPQPEIRCLDQGSIVDCEAGPARPGADVGADCSCLPLPPAGGILRLSYYI